MERRKDSKGKVLKEGESERKDGMYQYRWTDRLGKRHTVYAGTLKELREKETDILKNIGSGICQSAKLSVYQLTKKHLEETRSAVKSNSYDTKQRNLRIIQAHTLGAMNVGDVLVRDVKRFVKELSEEGYKYETIKNVLSLSRPAFQELFDENAIPRNPFVFKLKDVIKADKIEKTILTEKQYQSLISFMAESKVYRKHLGMLMLFHETGIRVGELCGLTFECFDLDKKVVHISQQMIFDRQLKKQCLSSPKTNSGIRTLPLSNEAMTGYYETLKSRPVGKTEKMIDGQVGFLFISNHGRPFTNRDITGIFDRLIGAYNDCHNEPLPNITPHSLRHEYCTRLVRAKMNIKLVQYLMGHSTPEITLRVYTHILKEEVQMEAINEFNKIIS